MGICADMHFVALWDSRTSCHFPTNWCYTAPNAVRGVKHRHYANYFMKLLSRSSISGDYRGIIEKMVEVECKLTGIEVAHYW